MPTTVIDGIVDDADGFNINNSNDFFFLSSSFIRATDTNAEGITVENGADVRSVVTVAGDVIGNRVGVELDGSDALVVSQGGTVLSERAFGIRTLNSDNFVSVAGTVSGTDVGVELDGDNDRLNITKTGFVSGALDENIAFRPSGVNMRGQNNVLENAGTITTGLGATDQPAVANFIDSLGNPEDDDLDATVINTGNIFGDVLLFAGEDIYDGTGGGFVDGLIDLGRGDDVFRGGALAETASGGDDADNMRGGAGGDSLSGDAGEDTLRGNEGADELDGGDDADLLLGGDGSDILRGGAGDDTVRGGDGADDIKGDTGNDDLRGNAGDDTINGNTGDDLVQGGSGDDEMRGGGGKDTLNGGKGDDTLTGNNGGDVFDFDGAFGQDQITDFSDSNREKIDLSNVGSIRNFQDLVDNHLSQDGADAVIDAGNGNTITLLDFNANALDAGDFIF